MTALERFEPRKMVAMDMTEKACQRRIIHDISKVINWAESH